MKNTMKVLTLMLTVVAATFMLAACGSRVTKANFDKIVTTVEAAIPGSGKTATTKVKAKSILGKPSSESEILKTMTWKNGDDKWITLTFNNDNLVILKVCSPGLK